MADKNKKDKFIDLKAYEDQVIGEKTFLAQITPSRQYKLKEDYVECNDGSVMTILTIYDDFGKTNDLISMWGVHFITTILRSLIDNPDEINAAFVSTFETKSSKWVEKKQDAADSNTNNAEGSKKRKTMFRSKALDDDLDQIALELTRDNASYVDVALKYQITAKDLDTLNSFIDNITRELNQKIPGIKVTSSNGYIDKTFANLLASPEETPGKRIMMTSTQLAGFYNIVSRGIDDEQGVYVGDQVGEINNNAVVWDMTKFNNYAVIGASNKFGRRKEYLTGKYDPMFVNTYGTHMWVNQLITQLVRKQSRVFTLSLNGFNLSPNLRSVTSSLDMNEGLINPMEMFGRKNKDEQNAYDSNIEKWKVMLRQLARQTLREKGQNIADEELNRTVLTELTSFLEDLYVNYKMWSKNASRSKIGMRNLGIPHEQLPTLDHMESALETQRRKYMSAENYDVQKANAINEIKSLISEMKTKSIFNCITSPKMDTLGNSRHSLLDFTSLDGTNRNTLLLQIINTFSAIMNQAKESDVVIIYGADRITSLTQAYIEYEIRRARERGVRFVYVYKSPEIMLDNIAFNKMSSADYTLTGFMTPDDIERYDNALSAQKNMTDTIKSSISEQLDYRYYLRRNSENVCFDANPTNL